MKSLFILAKGLAGVVLLLMVVGFTAGLVWGLLDRLFKFGLRLVS